MPRFALFLLLIASATTGLGVAAIFGAMGAYYMASGIAVRWEASRDIDCCRR